MQFEVIIPLIAYLVVVFRFIPLRHEKTRLR